MNAIANSPERRAEPDGPETPAVESAAAAPEPAFDDDRIEAAIARAFDHERASHGAKLAAMAANYVAAARRPRLGDQPWDAADGQAFLDLLNLGRAHSLRAPLSADPLFGDPAPSRPDFTMAKAVVRARTEVAP